MPPKGAFYGSFEMQQQRRDVANDQFAMTPPAGNVPITTPSPSNNGPIHNSYGPPPQGLLKQASNAAKNRFTNANTPDAYYGAGGYFGAKHPNPNAEYFGKYEAEFIAHQQKMSNQMASFGNQPSKHEFNEGKPAEFPHMVKGETHPAIKSQMPPSAQSQQQLHGKNVDFHYNKAGNAHLAAQNFYNQHGPHNVNADGNHQMPMQYNSNQYFPNEFGNANNEMEYFEQKSATSQAQSGYYEMYNNSNNNGNEFNGAIDNAYTAPSNGQLPNEQHSEHFGYPQYYDGANQHQHHHQHHHHPHSQSGTASMPSMQQTPQLHQPNHIGHGPTVMNANHPQFHHGIANVQSYHAAQQMNGTGGSGPHLPNAQMDNSNSSSDFNFLSNLANDFAPEYYQLS